MGLLKKFLEDVHKSEPFPEKIFNKLLFEGEAWVTLSIPEILFNFFVLHIKHDVEYANMSTLLETVFMTENGDFNGKPSYFEHIYNALVCNDHLYNEGIFDKNNFTLDSFLTFFGQTARLYEDTNVPDRDRKYIEMFYDEYLSCAKKLSPVNTIWNALKELEDDLQDMKMYTKVAEMFYPIANRLNELDEYYIKIGKKKLEDSNGSQVKDTDFKFDIIRYYQRYSEPFQDPFTKKGDKIKATQKKLIKDFDKVFQGAPVLKSGPNLMFYRGVRAPDIKDFISHSPSYKSTTADLTIASNFMAGHKCCLLALSVESDVPLVSVNVRNDIFEENEYLLPRNAMFERDSTLDFTFSRRKQSQNELVNVYGFKVKIDPNFDFTDVDRLQEDTSLFNMQEPNSFFEYIMDKYMWIIIKGHSFHKVIYDYLTMKINVWLHNNHYYDKIEELLTEEIENMRSELIILSYTDFIDHDDFKNFFDVVENLRVSDILSGDLYHNKIGRSPYIPKSNSISKKSKKSNLVLTTPSPLKTAKQLPRDRSKWSSPSSLSSYASFGNSPVSSYHSLNNVSTVPSTPSTLQSFSNSPVDLDQDIDNIVNMYLRD
jgi:hypothetical protein